MHSSRRWRPVSACLPVFQKIPVLATVLALAATPVTAATLSGRVVDPDGRPVTAARVLVTSGLGTHADRATAADGTFEIRDLPAGDYDVQVAADGFAVDAMHIELAGTDRRDLSVKMRLSALSESIVVSAAQVDVPFSQTPDSVTVIPGADLRARQIESVADALRFVPGLSVVRSGGRGAVTSLFPRGGASNYSLVLVDGIRANSFGGGFDFGHLAVSDIDRIEIVRGPESALYGPNAIGSVVQIVTKRGARPETNALFEGGNQDTMRAFVHTNGSRGNWTWGAGAERSSTDGYTGLAPATGERVSNDDDRLTQGSGSVGWRQPGGPDILVNGKISRDERGFPGPFGSNPIGVFSGVDRVSRGVNETRQIGGRFSHLWSARVRQRVDANYANIASDFTSPFGQSSSGTGRFDGRVQEDFIISPAVSASGGVEFLRERGSSTFIVGAAGTPIAVHRSDLGAFGELRYVRRDQMIVTGGVRVEHLTRDAVEADPTAFLPRPRFSDQTTNSVNPKIAVSYAVSGSASAERTTRVHAAAGTGIRPPDAFEIAFTDNPNLKPERSRSVEAGIEQSLSRGTYVVRATFFLNRYDDLLVTVGKSLQNASRYRTDNISNARARGLELAADARLGRPVVLRVNYTLTDSEILSVDGLDRLAPAPFKVGDALLRRPKHQGAVDVIYAAGRVTAFGELTTRSRILDVEPNFGSFGGLFFTPGYTVGNAGASVRVVRALDVFARVLNITDRRYEETLGFPALRRSGIAGVRIVF